MVNQTGPGWSEGETICGEHPSAPGQLVGSVQQLCKWILCVVKGKDGQEEMRAGVWWTGSTGSGPLLWLVLSASLVVGEGAGAADVPAEGSEQLCFHRALRAHLAFYFSCFCSDYFSLPADVTDGFISCSGIQM